MAEAETADAGVGVLGGVEQVWFERVRPGRPPSLLVGFLVRLAPKGEREEGFVAWLGNATGVAGHARFALIGCIRGLVVYEAVALEPASGTDVDVTPAMIAAGAAVLLEDPFLTEVSLGPSVAEAIAAQVLRSALRTGMPADRAAATSSPRFGGAGGAAMSSAGASGLSWAATKEGPALGIWGDLHTRSTDVPVPGPDQASTGP